MSQLCGTSSLSDVTDGSEPKSKSKHTFYEIKKIVTEQANKWKYDYNLHSNSGMDLKLTIV